MSFCSLCYQSLLIKNEVNLTYQQQQRFKFFNAAHKGQVHDVITIRGDNFQCRHKFHLYCLVAFHSNYYLQEMEGEHGEIDVFSCPAANCRSYFTGPNGFLVTPFEDHMRLFSPEDPRVAIFNHPDVVDLTNGEILVCICVRESVRFVCML